MEDVVEGTRPDLTFGRPNGATTARQRAIVATSVKQLLDALAPEATPTRHQGPPAAVQRHRSPRGCVLQGDVGAVSVSWFPGGATDETLGELQLIAWAGVVSLPGAARRAAGGARSVAQDLLRPVEPVLDQCAWRGADGVVLDAGALAERCLALLAVGSSAAGAPAAGAPAAGAPAAGA